MGNEREDVATFVYQQWTKKPQICAVNALNRAAMITNMLQFCIRTVLNELCWLWLKLCILFFILFLGFNPFASVVLFLVAFCVAAFVNILLEYSSLNETWFLYSTFLNNSCAVCVLHAISQYDVTILSCTSLFFKMFTLMIYSNHFCTVIVLKPEKPLMIRVAEDPAR